VTIAVFLVAGALVRLAVGGEDLMRISHFHQNDYFGEVIDFGQGHPAIQMASFWKIAQ
jgi:hypothetical protein